MINVGIIGGAGYTAGELIRILVNHPRVHISFVHSESNAGNRICDVHEGLIGDTDLVFCDSFDLSAIDVLFLCGAHGKSGEFWQTHTKPQALKIIDLAQDYRDESCDYVYGLPEWQRGKIRNACKVANPGCFATAIQLSLLPLAAAGLLSGETEVTAITGSTGAGVKPSASTHFSWRDNNVSSYKVFSHQHLKEICRNLRMAAGKDSKEPVINFVPVRGGFTRGIFATAYTDCDLPEDDIRKMYEDFYADAAFTFVSAAPVDLKQVINTNKAVVHVEKCAGKAVITTVIDNLLKGASGQAVQNMNLMFGLEESEGLKLKASAF